MPTKFRVCLPYLIILLLVISIGGAAFASASPAAVHYADLNTLMSQGILYTPNSALNVHTTEFSYRAEVNNFGFRDDDASVVSDHECRILVLGDSFTWGWGVEQDDIWPARVESHLQEAGYDAEVLNLALPGAGSSTEVVIGQTAIPLFKPDAVVVGVLMGQDIMQTEENPAAMPRTFNVKTPPSTFRPIRSFVARYFPALVSAAAPRSVIVEPYYTVEDWKWRTNLILGLNPDIPFVFGAIDGEAQFLFRSGLLNPGMIWAYIWRAPDGFVAPLTLDSPEMQGRISVLAEHLGSIAAISPRVIVFSVPYNVYVDSDMLESRARMGINVTPEMLTSTAMDTQIQLAVQQSGAANMEFVSVTEQFRADAANQRFFYYWDGHMNKAGHGRFADLIWQQTAGLCG